MSFELNSSDQGIDDNAIDFAAEILVDSESRVSVGACIFKYGQWKITNSIDCSTAAIVLQKQPEKKKTLFGEFE